MKQFVRLASDFKNDRFIGEKSRGIKILMKNGYLVPLTYVCSSDAYNAYVDGSSPLMKNLEEELKSKIDINQSYSVRSSASLEDKPTHSFAGQFKTYLNVKGVAQILESVRRVWDSTKSDRIATYCKRSSIPLEKLRMAVIIQQMVNAEIAGVAFTKNPLNGRDEVIIEAVKGFGDSLGQDGVNPHRGVYGWGEWIEKPDISGIPSSLLKKVAKKAKALERKQGAPLNLEWAYDGQSLYWLQLREINKLSDLPFYSNKMAKEFLPGIIKPLVWSINIPVVCGAWISLLFELVSNLNIKPQDLAKQFHYRAYFNMGIIGDIFDAFGMPREGLEVLMGYGSNAPEKPSFKPGLKSIRHFPKLLAFAVDKSFFGRKMRKFVRDNDAAVERICSHNLEMPAELETIDIIERLCQYNKKAAYFVIVSQLLNAFYSRILMNQLEKIGKKLEDTDLGYAGYARATEINPNEGIRKLHQNYIKLPEDVRQMPTSFLKVDEEGEKEELNRFKREFHNFIRKFGHLSDQGNDFSRVPWREQPQLVLDMIVSHNKLRHPSDTKINRNKRIAEFGFLLNWIYHKARESLEYKERISFNYSKSYSLFRDYFLHLARLFQMKNYISERDDIYYFTFDEIKNTVRDGGLSSELSKALDKRKREIAENQNIELPDVIYGNKAPIPIRKDSKLKRLRGIPASSGYYTGNTCVVKGVQDFSKVTKGAVVVIPFSDISWTPAFTKAGAVISESGGILSHCAIITREYGIPSIVGVKDACDLGDGKKVYVDGFSGEVTLL